MISDPTFFRQWVETVRARYGPAAARELAAARADIARFRTESDDPEPPQVGPDEVAALAAECERLAAEQADLEEKVGRAEAAQRDRLRAALAERLDEADRLLREARAVGWREVVADADAVLKLEGGRSFGELTPADLPGVLAADSAVDTIRAEFEAQAAVVAGELAGEADVLSRRDSLRAECKQLEADIAAARAHLRTHHGVADEVLAALPAVAADRAFHEFLDRLRADAEAEAGWGLPVDVFAPFRVG